MPWAAQTLPDLSAPDLARLDALPRQNLPKGMPIFRPGDRAIGFAVVLQGRIEVHLTGPSGREILLYAVEPGQSCIQTTLGLMGDAPYTGEAIAATDCTVVMIPAAQFRALMDASAAFRSHVFRAFAARMTEMTTLLERVAFTRVEQRLAAQLLALAQNGTVLATHAELAARIGSAREVVSRRLDALARSGVLRLERGQITLTDPAALHDLSRPPL